MTWEELAIVNLHAAHALFRENMYRPSITRSYYSAYAGLTWKLVEMDDMVRLFTHAKNNPSHTQLPKLLGQVSVARLNRMGVDHRNMGQIKKQLRRLLNHRIEADYIPGRTINKVEAYDRLRDARGLLSQIGVAI